MPRAPRIPNNGVSHAKLSPDLETSDEVTDVPADGLGSVLSELAEASSSRITVYRYSKGQPLAYVCHYSTPESFELDDLRDVYNGGEFRLYVSKNGTLLKIIKVLVEPGLAKKEPADAAASAPDVASVVREEISRALPRQREPASAAPAPFDLSALPAIITAIAGAITALRPPPPPPVPVVAPAGADPNAMINMLLKGMDIMKDIKESSGGDGEPKTLMGLMSDLIRSPMAQAAVAAMAQPQPATPKLPAPRPQQPQQPTAAPEPPASTQEPTNMFAMYLSQLVKKAEAGSDPTLYAELILDQLPDETIIELLNKKPSTMDFLIATVPQVANHRQWFETLVEVVARAFEDDAENDGEGGVDKPSGGVVESAHDSGTTPPVIPGQPSAG